MKMKLKNKTALITGASSGIGKETAKVVLEAALIPAAKDVKEIVIDS